MTDAPLYRLTDADRAMVAEAHACFALDFRYLEKVLWTARDRLEDAGRVRAARAEVVPAPVLVADVVERVTGLEPRLGRYVDLHPCGCLVWTGSLTGAGQPALRLGPENKVRPVRRWVYEQLIGPVPGNRRALSGDGCRPRCVHPDHVVVLAKTRRHR